MKTASIGASFHDYFQLVLADSNDLRTQAYRLRYEVYCREFHFEPEESCTNQREQDDYDAQSVHCLLMHHPTGQTAGCVRLVLADPGEPAAPLPFERHCGSSLDHAHLDPALMHRDRIGEISRLAVLARFRRRVAEDQSPVGLNDETTSRRAERRQFPYISLSLYLAAASVGLLSGLDGVFAMMELRLARHLTRYGIKFTQVGSVVEYHGPRAPFYISRSDLLGGLRPDARELLDVVTDDLSGSFQRARMRVIR